MTNQYYADYHFHTESSPDSVEPLSAQIEAAHGQGMDEICVTDHWDLVDQEDPMMAPDVQSWKKLALEQTLPQGFILRFGIEVGEGFANLEATEQVLAAHPYDFVLGSVHSVGVKEGDVVAGPNGEAVNQGRGKGIYGGLAQCATPEDFQEFFKDYFDTLLIQSQQTYFDSLGHIIYPFRYLPPNTAIKMEDYSDEIAQVLKNIIANDKVFELNTTRGRTVDVWKDILLRYRDLGGSLVTIGSDAHKKPDMSLGMKEAVALLKSLDFKSYAHFVDRKRIEIPII